MCSQADDPSAHDVEYADGTVADYKTRSDDPLRAALEPLIDDIYQRGLDAPEAAEYIAAALAASAPDEPTTYAAPEAAGDARLTDSDKLLLLAAWFDMWDRPDADRQAILDDDRFPGKNDVQRDLRRMAAALAASAPDEGPRPLAGHPWLVRLTCCGRSDGAFAAPTYEEAAAFRESYTTGVGTVGHPLTPNGHQRTAVIEDALAARPAVPALDPYTERREHERQSLAGTHNFDPQCPFCFFDAFDAETRAEYAALSPKELTE